ncbi:hypothetical protein KIW84_043098 [Lathyrus oleraceus]|uniref:Uncharacterized protein n=1 Tax=Pisum sativum TaxID=3888 RepID=A0A9D4XEI0_PEA|nr:hypothetical protein KIW84_043098 [Pisum sativum]
MAFANYLPPLQLVKPSLNSPKPSLFFNPSFFLCSHHFNFPSVLHNRSSISTLRKITVKAKPQEPEVSVATDAFTQFKHLLLPITDRKPYLSEGTKQLLMNSRRSLCLSMKLNFPASDGIYLKVD